MAKHHYDYKTTKAGYWVVCAECGNSDRLYKDELDAKARVKELNDMSCLTKSPALNRLFPKRNWR